MKEIREIKPNEYKFLREMLYEAIYLPKDSKKLPKSIVYEPSLSKYVDNFERQADFAFVLVIETKLVGAIWTRLFTKNEQGYGFVDEQIPELSMAIFESHRNLGFGRILIEKIIEVLKYNGFEKVSLSVDKQNRALNLYKRVGFEIISEHGTAFTMLKTL